MKVLVVGGAGYLGGSVVDFALEQGYDVRVYDHLLYEESYLKPVDFIHADVRDTKILKKHIDWADAIIWLAAIVGDGACELNPALAQEINHGAVKTLVKFCGKKRVIFTSTCSVYGTHNRLIDETASTKPLSVYASTKLAAEEELSKSDSIIFRLGTLYGLSDCFARIRFDLVVNTLTAKAYKYSKIVVFGGRQYRPLLHVKDAARTIVDQIPQKNTGIYNLKSENIVINDLVKKIKKHFPDLSVQKQARTFKDTRNYRVSSKKAEKKIGFAPELTVNDGIEEIKKILIEKRIVDIDNTRYTNQGYLSALNGREH